MSASGLAAHLSPAELGQRYRAARCPVERSHLQIVWLLSLGRSEREVAQVTGYGRRWVGEVARRYDEDGPGRPRRSAARERRRQAAPGRRGRGGAAGRVVHAARRRRACGPVPRWRRGWRSGSAARCGRSAAGTTSRKLGHSAQVPRPRHAEAASPEEQAAYKKSSPRRWASVASGTRGFGRSRSGLFDEHRLGLKPVLRRQWAPEGQRPVAVGRHRYEWLYLYGFVHPATGEVVWFVCSTVDVELLGAVLAAFAAAVGAGEGKLIVLVLDNAGWHISGDSVAPPGSSWRSCRPTPPSCSRPSTCGRWRTRPWRTSTSPRSKDLDVALSERCCTLAAMPEVIKAATHLGLAAGRHPAQLAGALISRISRITRLARENPASAREIGRRRGSCIPRG